MIENKINKRELMRFANLLMRTGLTRSESLKAAWVVYRNKSKVDIQSKIRRVYNLLLANKIKNSTAWPTMLALLSTSDYTQNEIDTIYTAFIHVCEYKNAAYTIGVPPSIILSKYIDNSYVVWKNQTIEKFEKFHLDNPMNVKTKDMKPIEIFYKMVISL